MASSSIRQTAKSIQLFKNPYLEKLTHVHPITPLVVWVPVLAFLVWRSFFVHGLDVLTFSTLVISALLAWTLVEYLMHRFVFHFRARGPLQERIAYLIHGIHHDSPEDATRLVVLPGESQRVQGFELGLSGDIGERWHLMGGYAWQKGELTRDIKTSATAAVP